MRKLLELLFHRPQLVEDAQALLEDGPAAEREAVLRQVANGHSLHAQHDAVVERFHAAQHLHQRRFAGAIGPYQSGLLRGGDEPVGIFKEESRTEALARAGELQHNSILPGPLIASAETP